MKDITDRNIFDLCDTTDDDIEIKILESKFLVTLKDVEGNTPLHKLVEDANWFWIAVKCFEKESFFTLKNNKGEVPFDIFKRTWLYGSNWWEYKLSSEAIENLLKYRRLMSELEFESFFLHYVANRNYSGTSKQKLLDRFPWCGRDMRNTLRDIIEGILDNPNPPNAIQFIME